MDFGKAFTFMFDDPNWLQKLGIGTVVGLIGIVFTPLLIGLIPIIILLGYTLDTLRNVMDGRERPLPEWEDWGGFLLRGFRLLAAFFVWALPAILAAIPLGLGSALADQGRGMEAVGIILIVCSSCLLILWGLFVTLISPAIYARLARLDRFSAAFEFGKIWAFTRDNIGNVIVAILLTWVAGLIASVIAGLGLIALLIGIIVTIPFASLWQYLVQAHLFGQVAANSITPVD
ncbi:MAG: DUF4013 domain-containing protein [Anaerolineae bacterium]|nr:DUF4013 domain-containing protein [Anaerolineae bacterium]